MSRSIAITPKDVTRWLDDAHHALDHAPALTVDQLRALAATPETPGRDDTHRRTWWSEEAARVQSRAARDRMPDDPAHVAYWQQRQDHYAAQVETLLDAHAEALLCAREHAIGPTRAAAKHLQPKRLRKTAAALALDATIEDAA